MSYILEALADSEQARQQIAAVPRYSLLPVMGEEMPQQRRWPYALAGALLVNAAVLQIWLRPALPGGVASITVPTVPQVAQAPAAPDLGNAPLARTQKPAADVAGTTLPEVRPPQSQPERAYDRAVRLPAPADALPRTASANVANGSTLIHVPKLAPKVTAKRSAEAAIATEAKPVAPSPTAPSLPPPSPTSTGGTAELPPVLQHELPALSVAGFIRGEGSSSMVIVNDRLVREGDEVAPGVKLEKIINDSLVFSYKGYHFKR